jgi:hypothetical protein
VVARDCVDYGVFDLAVPSIAGLELSSRALENAGGGRVRAIGADLV